MDFFRLLLKGFPLMSFLELRFVPVGFKEPVCSGGRDFKELILRIFSDVVKLRVSEEYVAIEPYEGHEMFRRGVSRKGPYPL